MVDVIEKEAAAFDIEADCWFIQKQQRGFVYEGAGEFDATALATREGAYAILGAGEQADAVELFLDARLRGRARKTVQRGVIGEIFVDGQIEVERGLLKHDAEARQRRERFALDIMAVNGDAALSAVIKPGDQGEESRLAGAVEAKENREVAGLHGEIDVVQDLSGCRRRG